MSAIKTVIELLEKKLEEDDQFHHHLNEVVLSLINASCLPEIKAKAVQSTSKPMISAESLWWGYTFVIPQEAVAQLAASKDIAATFMELGGSAVAASDEKLAPVVPVVSAYVADQVETIQRVAAGSGVYLSASWTAVELILPMATSAVVGENRLQPSQPKPLFDSNHAIAAAKGISLHIGLNRYDARHYGSDGTLVACENDARDMQRLAQEMGFETMLLLTKAATRHGVITAVKNAARELTSGDMLLISYSGHGGQIKDTSGDEEDERDETWCLFDGQLIDDELEYLWSLFKAGVRIVVLSDSCHSGTVLKGIEDDNQAAEPEPAMRVKSLSEKDVIKTFLKNQAFYEDLNRHTPQNVVVNASVLLISACLDEELAVDGDDNGAFTGELLAAWQSGGFTGSYTALFAEIGQRLKSKRFKQTPNLSTIPATDTTLRQQRPFQI